MLNRLYLFIEQSFADRLGWSCGGQSRLLGLVRFGHCGGICSAIGEC